MDSLIFGANSGYYDDLVGAVPGCAGRRVYDGVEDHIGTNWPGTTISESWPGVKCIYSIRPTPSDLLAGNLDAQIKTLLGTAPAGSDLTAWHEAGNQSLGYPPYITAATMRKVHTYMQGLCRGTRVSYGVIIVGPPSSLQPWMARGLDWYGLDLYDSPHFRSGSGGPAGAGGTLDIKNKLNPRLASWLKVSQSLSGLKWPKLNICETNSRWSGERSEWFTAVADWLSRNGGWRMTTYWNAGGTLSGDWLPGDTATINTLRTLVAKYS